MIEYVAPVIDSEDPVIDYASPAAACAAHTPVIDSAAPLIEYASPAVAYAAPTTVIEHVVPTAAYAAPSPVIDSVAPVSEYVSPTAAYAAPAPVIDSVAPVIESMSSCAARVPETEYVSSSPAAACASPTPVIDSVASAPAVTRKSEFEALRANTEAELLELVTAYAKLEAEKADLAAQSLITQDEQQAAQTNEKPKEAQQAAVAFNRCTVHLHNIVPVFVPAACWKCGDHRRLVFLH